MPTAGCYPPPEGSHGKELGRARVFMGCWRRLRVGGRQAAGLWLLLGAALGCGSEPDLRITGANRAATSLASLRTLWENLGNGGTRAQDALLELAHLPGGLAAMLLRPIELPAASQGAAVSAASFPECAQLSRRGTCDVADFSVGCQAGGFVLTGSSQRCESSSCSGGQAYSGTFQLGLSTAQATGSFTLSMHDVCVTPTSAAGSLTSEVRLELPGVPASHFTLAATVANLRFDGGVPVAGTLTVDGAGTFVGGPLAGCVTVEWTPTGVVLRRVSSTSCTTP